MQRMYELKPLILGTMKRAFQYLLLIVVLASCQAKYVCTDIGCQIVEKKKKIKQKNTFFKISDKNKLRKKPKQGLFPKKVFKPL